MQAAVMPAAMTGHVESRKAGPSPRNVDGRGRPGSVSRDSDGDAVPPAARHAPPGGVAAVPAAPPPPPHGSQQQQRPSSTAVAAAALALSSSAPSAGGGGEVEVEGTGCRYILRDEIGRGAYGKVYLADVVHVDPMQSPAQLPSLRSTDATLNRHSSNAASANATAAANLTLQHMNANASSSSTINGQRNSCSTSSANSASRMVLKRMENASVEDGLQAATLREIMVLDEVSMGSFDRERAEVEAFASGRVVFRANPNAFVQRSHDAAGCSSSDNSNHHHHHHHHSNKVNADERWTDEVLAASISRNDDYDYFSAALRRRINMGRNFLIGMRDTIMLPREHLAYVAMDYCEGGDLWHFLRDVKLGLKTSGQRFGEAMPPRVFRRWAVELILALAFLHSHNISHRDLKPQNLMLSKRTDLPARPLPSASAGPSPHATPRTDLEGEDDGEVDDRTRSRPGAATSASSTPATALPAGEEFSLRVGDFGLSRLEDIPYKKYVHEAVTLWYRSPDVLLGNTNYTFTADAWSLGCILVEMACGSVLFKGRDEADELRHIFTRGCRPSLLNFPRMKDYPYAQKFEDVLQKYRDTESEMRSPGDGSDGDAAMHAHVEKLARHLRAFLKERNAHNLLGAAGIDLVARLLIFDPERRFTVLQAVRHQFFTDAYAEVYGSEE